MPPPAGRECVGFTAVERPTCTSRLAADGETARDVPLASASAQRRGDDRRDHAKACSTTRSASAKPARRERRNSSARRTTQRHREAIAPRRGRQQRDELAVNGRPSVRRGQPRRAPERAGRPAADRRSPGSRLPTRPGERCGSGRHQRPRRPSSRTTGICLCAEARGSQHPAESTACSSGSGNTRHHRTGDGRLRERRLSGRGPRAPPRCAARLSRGASTSRSQCAVRPAGPRGPGSTARGDRPSSALFEPRRRPWQLEVDDEAAALVEVQTLRRRVGGEKHRSGALNAR